MKYVITTLLLLFALTVTTAQAKKWTLQECVEYAVENNITVEQFELDLETTKIDESDAFGNFLPNLNATSSASNNVGFSIVPGSNAPTTESTFRFNAGLNSNVTLFDGLRNINRLNRAKMNSLANQYRLDDLKDDIRLQVALSYLNIISNKETLETVRAQYAETEQSVKRTAELVDAGVLPKGDLLEIEATAAVQEQRIVNTENLVLISRISLAQLLQITDYENFDVADVDLEVPISEVLNSTPKEIFAKALTFRNDIKFSESNITLAEQDVKIAKGALLPTISGFLNYSTGYSNKNEIRDANNDFFLPNFTDQLWIFDGVSYGAQINIPIFNRYVNKNNIQRSQINVLRSQLQLEQNKLELETDINQAYVDVKSFAKAYEASQKTLESTTLAYQYSKERYDVGLLNAFDFSQAQIRVDNAEADVVRTKYDYIFRLKILEFYFGIPIALD